MKIVATVKQVPNPSAPLRLDADLTVARETDSVLDPGDECGVEIALQLAEAHGGEVVLVSMGPPESRDAVRRGLAMGADRGIVVSDERLSGSDALQTARVLAATIAAEAPDLVVCGTESYDGATGLVPPMVAGILDLPQLTNAISVEVRDGGVAVRRRTERGEELVEAGLPALVTVTGAIAEPRYPSLKGVMAAKKKPVEARTLDDVGIELAAPVETIERVTPVAVRGGGVIVEDEDGSAVAQIVELLARAEVL
jgi:electron transfer flavoprotein beta subunit